MSHDHQQQQAHKNKGSSRRQPVQPAQEMAVGEKDNDHLDRIWAPKGSSDAITPILHGLSQDLEQRYSALDLEHDTQEHREKVVGEAARELWETSAIVAPLLEELSPSERARYQEPVDRVGLTVNKLLRFIRTRAAHQGLERDFTVGVARFDQVLAKLGAPPVESRDHAVLSERAVHEAEQESSEVSEAEDKLLATLDSVNTRQQAAIGTFDELAHESDIAQPDFMEAFLKALVMGTIGVFSDMFIALAIGKAVAMPLAAGATAATRVVTRSLPTAREAITSMAKVGLGATAQAVAATAASTKIDPNRRALAYFTGAMRIGAADRIGRYRGYVQSLVKDSAVTAAALREMEATFAATIETVYQRSLTECAKAWATYLAQSRLGAHFAGHKKVSNMHDYFGDSENSGRAFGTDRSGGSGVLSLLFVVDHDGAPPRLDDSQTHVIGVNSELKTKILDDAGHNLSHVSLPKEIHVQARFARATIALDENNRIRDVSNWQSVEPAIGETAFEFWKHRLVNLEVR